MLAAQAAQLKELDAIFERDNKEMKSNQAKVIIMIMIMMIMMMMIMMMMVMSVVVIRIMQSLREHNL